MQESTIDRSCGPSGCEVSWLSSQRLEIDDEPSAFAKLATDAGWGDGGDLSRGYPGTMHWRNSQTIVNSAYLDAWFWTSSSPTLEKQAHAAITGALAGNLKPVLAEERLRKLFRAVEQSHNAVVITDVEGRIE